MRVRSKNHRTMEIVNPRSGRKMRFPPRAPQRIQRRTKSQVSNWLSMLFQEIVNRNVGIRAKNVDVALGRLPAGFYAVVQHGGNEWKTENKSVLVVDDVVEWGGPIPM